MTATAIPVIACVGVDQSANAPIGEFSYSMTFEHRKRIDPVFWRDNQKLIATTKSNLVANGATMWRIDTWSDGSVWIWWNGGNNAIYAPDPKKPKPKFIYRQIPGR